MTRTRTKKPSARARPQDVEDMQDQQLQRMRAEFGVTGRTVKLYRQNPKPPRIWEYVTTMEASPDLVEEVKEAYGGGAYKAKLYEEGEYVLGGTFNFSIAGKPKPIDEEEPKPPAKPDEDVALDRFLSRITAVVTIVSPLLAPLLKNLGGSGGDTAATIALMREAERDGERRGEKLGRLEAGAGGGEGHWTDLAQAYLPVIQEMVTTVKRRPNGAAPAPAAPPAQLPPAATVPVPPGYEWLEHLRPFYPQLAQQASRGTNAATVADFALDQMSEPLFEHIAQATTRDDFLERMRAELNEIKNTEPAWLEAFLARIVEDCQETDEAEPAQIQPPKTKRGKK